MAKTLLKYNTTHRSISAMVKKRDPEGQAAETFDLVQRIRIQPPKRLSAVDDTIQLTLESLVPGTWYIGASMESKAGVKIINQKKIGLSLILEIDPYKIGQLEICHIVEAAPGRKRGVIDMWVDVNTGDITSADFHELKNTIVAK